MTVELNINNGFFRHHKTLKLKKRIGSDGVLCLLQLWAYVAEVKPNGDISSMSAEDIELAVSWDGDEGAFVRSAVEAGFIEADESGNFSMHDWDDHSGLQVKKAKEKGDVSRLSRMASTHPDLHRELIDKGYKGISKDEYYSLTNVSTNNNVSLTTVNDRSATYQRTLNDETDDAKRSSQVVSERSDSNVPCDSPAPAHALACALARAKGLDLEPKVLEPKVLEPKVLEPKVLEPKDLGQGLNLIAADAPVLSDQDFDQIKKPTEALVADLAVDPKRLSSPGDILPFDPDFDLASSGQDGVRRKKDIPDLTACEREILGVLKTVKGGYRYDFEKDIAQIRKLAVEYPHVDMLMEVRKIEAWAVDKTATKIKNSRSFLRNWISNSRTQSRNAAQSYATTGDVYARAAAKSPDEILARMFRGSSPPLGNVVDVGSLRDEPQYSEVASGG